MENFIIREIIKEDYDYGFTELMYEFTNYNYQISKEEFCKYIDKNNCKIIIIYSKKDNRIIGSGTIFKIDKIHNNPIGLIEDVIITKTYRSIGLGKLIIDKLIQIGKNDFGCYKIILNCLEKNIGFYEKCGFSCVGVEMKFI